jgi:hypothetical protein
MRRTTISRSRIGVTLAAALLVSAAAARAQDTLQVPAQQPPEQPQVQGQVHVVAQGETLWGLAQQFLGDPLLWPEIYRLNTALIEDPHWIFPGEQLVLGGAPAAAPVAAAAAPDTMAPQPAAPEPATPGVLSDTTQVAGQPPVEAPAVEAPAPPPPVASSDFSSPTVFARRAHRAGAITLGAVGGDAYRYRPVRRGEFYSAGFLTEDTSFPWGKVVGDPNEDPTERSAETSSVSIYQRVLLEAPAGATYQPGDSLLVARLGREVPGWGNVVVPAGIVRVTHTRGQEVLGEVVQQFGRVVDGLVAVPLEPFHDPGMVTPQPVDNGLETSVIAARDVHAVPDQQNIIFLDAGRTQGVSLGDVFEVRQTASSAPTGVAQPVALLEIVHVRDRSSSGLIVQIYEPGLQPGQPAQLVRKMPS